MSVCVKLASFFILLRLGLGIDNSTSIELTDKEWEIVFSSAMRHDVFALIGKAIQRLPQSARPSVFILKKLESQLIPEVAQNDNQLFAVDTLAQRFEENRIYGMAVKGILTKKRYPESVMRSMGDIDILCRGSQNEQVKKAMRSLGYDLVAEGRKHDHYSLPPFVAVEMHRDLLDAESEFYAYYQNIWDRCLPKAGCIYWHELSVEDEYLFSFIHLVEHFKNGGIGVRFILDTYVYEHSVSFDRSYVENELNTLGLLEFYHNVVALADRWFGENSGDDDNELLSRLGQFILDGGVYGTSKNSSAISTQRRGGFLLACFPKLGSMRSLYPWLEKVPFLLPFAWGLRAVQALRFRRKNIHAQWARHMTGDKRLGQELRQFYKECGLNL